LNGHYRHGKNFQARAPKIRPRILCIGMPVRDLTFRVQGVPARGSKQNASFFEEICGGNSLNAAIGIARLGGRVSLSGPMGDSREISSRYIFEQLAQEGSRPNNSCICAAWRRRSRRS
jgi:sugar/nucleoside kinase (ribokinase family)